MPTHAHVGPATRLQCLSANERLPPSPTHLSYVSGPTRSSSRSACTSNNIAPLTGGGDDGISTYNDARADNIRSSFGASIHDHRQFPPGHSFVTEDPADHDRFQYSNGTYDLYPQDQSTSSNSTLSSNTLSSILHQHPSQSRPNFPSSGRFDSPIGSQSQHPNESSSVPCSPNTFFASHKAHRSFKGVVEKFHQKTDLDQVTTVSNDPTDWSHWNPGTKESSNDQAVNPQLISQESSGHRTHARQSQPEVAQEMPAPYITRSQVHRLAEARQDSTLNLSTTSSPFHHQPQSNTRISTRAQSKTRSSPCQSNLEDHTNRHSNQQLNDKSGSNHSGKAYLDNYSSSGPARNNDGLPSNSHHLLNSPENKSYRIPPSTGATHNRRSEVQGGKSGPNFGSASDHRPTTQDGHKNSSNVRRSAVTPNKQKSNHRDLNTSEETPDHPDDAASLLLALSRSEEPKHGMALRRGRGSSAPRVELLDLQPLPTQQKTSREKSAGPPTPSGRRYRTRSQIHDEVQQHESQDRYYPAPFQASLQAVSHPIYATRARGSQTHSQQLGHGLPSLVAQADHGPHVSVSGSTAASTCTTSSSMVETHGVVNHQHGPFMMRTSSIQTRNRPRVSDCSTTPSMMTVRTMTSNSTTITGLTDDDAKSSFSISTQATSLTSPTGKFTSKRTFPPEVPIDPNFPRLYRSFHVSSGFGEKEPIRIKAELNGIKIIKEPLNSHYNIPAHGHLDLYTPRFVKGVGNEKVGLCCICSETKERGGEDLNLWLKMKVSSYSYHLGFFHGINNADGLPFSPPIQIRLSKRGQVAANEKSELKEGRCHQCNKWIPMEGVKLQEVKVPELFWWKHAKSCHKSRILGECHVHVEDDLYDLVTGLQMKSKPPHSSSSTSSNIQPSSAPHSSGSNRIHPSVAAQRASAGRVYKRKASTSSLNQQQNQKSQQEYSPYNNSVGLTPSSSLLIHHHHHQPPQSPTPQVSYHQQHQQQDLNSTTNITTNSNQNNNNNNLPPPRKTRRSNAWKPTQESEG
ncbi:hypothetical protein CROQUDRAFT_135389 [Cronartium quercuum f. sp. fusiforme G11]|uniref:Transcription regulator Rua1 C-terminal domain-containing protein n=1 Tax=Cronartium quercuum f. sp. fusiforme G11 TaxID=708437 RepID=A0A9P6NA13_9BASI|nr:hypothetical protein CROQUDRAFT_135389 [Cronartium quercuum f. sp. fusiforme G11]